jgi:uncharacterized membrane protein
MLGLNDYKYVIVGETLFIQLYSLTSILSVTVLNFIGVTQFKYSNRQGEVMNLNDEVRYFSSDFVNL